MISRADKQSCGSSAEDGHLSARSASEPLDDQAYISDRLWQQGVRTVGFSNIKDI